MAAAMWENPAHWGERNPTEDSSYNITKGKIVQMVDKWIGEALVETCWSVNLSRTLLRRARREMPVGEL